MRSINIDVKSGEPIWKQIVEQIKYQVASGELEPGEQLPSIRALSNELVINSRTVMKAYEKLKYEGLTVMRQGQGVFITLNEDGVPEHIRRERVADQAKRLISEAVRLGSSPDEIREIIDQELNRIE